MSKEFNSFLTGLLVGTVAGATAGLLLAPKSGEETRKDIQKLGVDVKSKTEDVYTQAKKSLDKKVKAIKNLGKKIDETKYSQLVEEIVDEYKKKELLNSETAKNLGKQLKKDWNTVKKAIAA